MSKARIIILIILITIPVATLGFLLSKDLVINGRLEITSDLRHASSFILLPGAENRFGELKQDNSGYYRRVITDPAYFDLRLPRPFRQVTLSLTYQADPKEKIQLAIFVNKDKWQFDTEDFEQVEDLSDGWRRGQVTFQLSDKRFAYNKYQAMISLPQIKDSGREVKVSEIKFLAEREPLTWQKIIDKIKGLL